MAPLQTDPFGRVAYRQLTFSQLDSETDAIAAGLQRLGVKPGTKLVLFVPFGIEFISLTFALFKAGVVTVLIDPGMGRKNVFKCLEEVQPEGFVAIEKVQLIRWLYGKRFRDSRFNISLKRLLPGVRATYGKLRKTDPAGFQPVATRATDPAAIIFTSGSTGPPKGVLYEHGMFDAQVDMIQRQYQIAPGEIDLPGFPLFGLFNAAMGVTTVIPDMDPTRPARVNPEKIITAIRDQGVTQAFGSPAFWNRVGRYCVENKITFPTIKRALSAGGPVPVHVLDRMKKVLTHPDADLFTPYGATECLPVASIGGQEVLKSTAPRTRLGAGTCVGRLFPGVDLKIIRVSHEAIPSMASAQELPAGEIGEIVVRSRSVTQEYYRRPEATGMAKIPDQGGLWHRMGDVGYLDEQGLLWFCGRKAHIVTTPEGPMYSVCCEAIFDEHPKVYRTALVGIGPECGQRPVIIVEPEPGEFPESPTDAAHLRQELLEIGRRHESTRQIGTVLFHRSLPVDPRHNVKINREELEAWARTVLRNG